LRDFLSISGRFTSDYHFCSAGPRSLSVIHDVSRHQIEDVTEIFNIQCIIFEHLFNPNEIMQNHKVLLNQNYLFLKFYNVTNSNPQKGLSVLVQDSLTVRIKCK